MRYSVRWELDNMIALCWACHRYWAHHKYEDCRDFLIERIGQKKFDALKIKAANPAKFLTSDLEIIYEELKKASKS